MTQEDARIDGIAFTGSIAAATRDGCTVESIKKAMESFRVLIKEQDVPDVYVTTDECAQKIRGIIERSSIGPYAQRYAQLWKHNACTAYGIPIESYPTRDMAIERARLIACEGRRVALITE